jgi:uncharacterized cupin superfamily protein
MTGSVVNLYEVEAKRDEGDPSGYETPYARVGALLGASALGLSVYDLAAGQSVCPYHYELGREEWLLVLSGRPTLRDPDGEHELAPGDVVLFPEGEEGAHKVTNAAGGVARVAILSNTDDPSIGIYPDSGKIGFWPAGKTFRLADEVDYYDGEVEPQNRGQTS